MGWATIPDDSFISELVPRAAVTHDVARRLREIDPYFVAKFNDKRQLFEIWRELPNHPPNLLMTVKNDDGSFRPVDNRTYRHLRWVVWFNQDTRRNMKKLAWEDVLKKRKAREDEDDFYYHKALEDRRVIQMASRELGYTSGKSKIPTVQGVDI